MDRRTWMQVSLGTAALPFLPAVAQDPPVSGDLRRRREENLRRLEAYAARKAFPLNKEVAGRVHPIFYDFEARSACAVGHLMIQDGRSEDVSKVARENNVVLIPDLRGGPVIEWIATSGLTQEECALIQPGYPWKEVLATRHSAEAIALIQMHLRNVGAFLATPEQTEHSLALADRRLMPRRAPESKGRAE